MNISQLVESKGLRPRRVSPKDGGEYACGCPKCGDGGKPTTSDRFHIWPHQASKVPGGTWWCRKCDHGGDVIEFLIFMDGLTYTEACKALGIEAQKYRNARRNSIQLPDADKPAAKAWQPREKEGATATEKWREQAAKLVEHAREHLEKDMAAQSLLEARGIPMEVARRHHLGWLPGERGRDYYRPTRTWGLPEEINPKTKKLKRLWIPSGIVIPLIAPKDAGGHVQRLRIRRSDMSMDNFPANDSRYIVIAGGDIPQPRMVINPKARGFVVVEAELDAIACAWAAEKAGLDVGAIGMGNNVAKPGPELHAILQQALCILVALDFDKPDEKGQRPGAIGAKWWLDTYPRARRYMVPQGKDPGDAVKLGVDLAAWISSGLPPVFGIKAPQRHPSTVQTDARTCPEVAQTSLLPDKAPQSRPATPSASLQKNMSMCRPDFGELSLRGAGQKEYSRRAPWHWLQSWPADPASALMVLEQAGLVVEKVQSEWGDDFTVTGWQRWPIKWQGLLPGWMRAHGHKVVAALYPEKAGEVAS